jgi:hypothetical protein
MNVFMRRPKQPAIKGEKNAVPLFIRRCVAEVWTHTWEASLLFVPVGVIVYFFLSALLK